MDHQSWPMRRARKWRRPLGFHAGFCIATPPISARSRQIPRVSAYCAGMSHALFPCVWGWTHVGCEVCENRLEPNRGTALSRACLPQWLDNRTEKSLRVQPAGGEATLLHPIGQTRRSRPPATRATPILYHTGLYRSIPHETLLRHPFNIDHPFEPLAMASYTFPPSPSETASPAQSAPRQESPLRN